MPHDLHARYARGLTELVSLCSPRVEVIRTPTRLHDAVWRHNLLARPQERLDDIGGITHKVRVDPQNERLVSQSREEQVIAATCEHRAPCKLPTLGMPLFTAQLETKVVLQ